MIIKMIQDHSPVEHATSFIEYSFFEKELKIGSFYAKNPPLLPVNFSGEYKGINNYKIVLQKNEECPEGYKSKMLVYITKESDGTKKSIGKYTYNYYDSNNNLVGKLYYMMVFPPKKHFFDLLKGYEYQSLKFNDDIYDLYKVMLGSEGIYYCIYKNSELVAMIEKQLNVEDFMDNYIIYSLNNIDKDILCLIASHFDYSNYEEAMPRSDRNSTHYNAMKEFKKEILSKYDPTFKQKIIDMDKQTL